jgi:hypothetical protein
MKITDLTPEERSVFGDQAVKIDGVIQERGTGSDFHREQIAATLRREAVCRGEMPTAQPSPEPPAPPVDYRPDIQSPFDPNYRGPPLQQFVRTSQPRQVGTPEQESARSPPPAPAPSGRTIDPKLVHAWPDRIQ